MRCDRCERVFKSCTSESDWKLCVVCYEVVDQIAKRFAAWPHEWSAEVVRSWAPFCRPSARVWSIPQHDVALAGGPEHGRTIWLTELIGINETHSKNGRYVAVGIGQATWSARPSWILSPPEPHRGNVMREYVKLYRDGNAYALSTNITDERVFMERASAALVDGITGAHTDNGLSSTLNPERELAQWLPQVVDVVCKLRGYKAPSVEEQRVLTAGRISPRDSAIVATSEDATPIVGRIEPDVATA